MSIGLTNERFMLEKAREWETASIHCVLILLSKTLVCGLVDKGIDEREEVGLYSKM
jgi:hypothetical protein